MALMASKTAKWLHCDMNTMSKINTCSFPTYTYTDAIFNNYLILSNWGLSESGCRYERLTGRLKGHRIYVKGTPKAWYSSGSSQ